MDDTLAIHDVRKNDLAQTRAWWHLWHTTWGGTALGFVLLVASGAPMGFWGNLYLSICGGFWAFLAGCFRTPYMKRLFARSASLPCPERRTALLWGTTLIFVGFVAVLFALYGCYWLLTQHSKLSGFRFDVLFTVYWISALISLPWLVAALLAVLYQSPSAE